MDSFGGSFAAMGITISACLGSYFYFRNVLQYWTKKGIPGPKGWPVVGNFLQLFFSDRAALERDWAQKFGKVYGIFQGTKPRLVVADRETLNQICIKDFDYFTDHEVSEFTNKYSKSFLFTLKGDHWKKVRTLMSPTFTSGKIKRMFRFLDICADDLIECVNEQLPKGAESEGVVVNMKNIYNLYAMDAIATCCYSIKLQRDGTSDLKSASSRDQFVKAAMTFSSFSLPRTILSITIPKVILRAIRFKVKPETVMAPIIQKASNLMELRRKSGKKPDDYLQLLLDAELNQQMETNDTDTLEDHHAGLNSETILAEQKRMVVEVEAKMETGSKNSKITLTDLEIVSSSAFLLSVGLDTTGTLLTNTTYLLAFHQDIQKKLQEELGKFVEFNEDKTKASFTYEALTSCQYLDAVLAESLRFMGPVTTVDRKANRDYYLEKHDLHLPKGSIVNLSFHGIMNDPDNFEEPRKFNPERFMPGQREKIKPGSYCPFGVGPRHCIGMRFSLTESKLALARLMMSFRFEPAPGTSFPPVSKFALILYNMKNPVVRFVPRIIK